MCSSTIGQSELIYTAIHGHTLTRSVYFCGRSKVEKECPDYHSSGPNTCFFDKAHSYLWMYYFVFVKATNALGSNVSTVFRFEIGDIVQTYPPRNLTLDYKTEKASLPYLLVTWVPPKEADVKMGWITLQYQVRLKEEKKHVWEEHVVDHQTKLKLFSLTPGEDYVFQVRCKADSKHWSEWSEESYIKIPGAADRKHVQINDWLTLSVALHMSKVEKECPDYHSSGPNTCFFDKAHSSVWVYYFVVVKATNALGSNVSTVFRFEVVDIVKTYPPRNLTLDYETEKASLPYLLVTWVPPEKADVKMGWITLQYQVRLKEEKKHVWEEHVVDHQTKLKLFSLTPGEDYVFQVRCNTGNKLWSEWSEESYIKIRGGPRKRDMTLWISIAVLSVIICLTMIWTMALKGCRLTPKSMDSSEVLVFSKIQMEPSLSQLCKSGKSEDLLSAFGCQGFPPTSDCEDLLVAFLEVDDSKEHLISSPERDPQSHHIKVSPVDTDNDSGRESCDSPFVPSEGNKDQRVLSQGFESAEISTTHDLSATKCPWPLQNNKLDYSDNKSFNWPDGRAMDNPSPNSSYHNITDICKLALGAMNVNTPAFLMPNGENSQQAYFRTIETIGEESQNKHIDLADLHSKGVDPDMLLLLANQKNSLMLPRAMDYVVVHKVNQNNALALIPKHKENRGKTDQYLALATNREYSKVDRVEGNNVLVLMPNPEVQVSPSIGKAMKEFAQKALQSQTAGFIRPAQNEGNMHTAGMGYLDPSSFMP
ncbi:PREDICTED: prolactin receptor [Nanorana parkeri]|uniref:prolactin receptor n=1 Tax=Nanorana parkeri TaxID=125878 RepID=UPI00085454D4|nr:PREDICTED: prolactin receptor [Nanorana parkeri]